MESKVRTELIEGRNISKPSSFVDKRAGMNKTTSIDYGDFKTYKQNFKLLPEAEKTRMEECRKFKIPHVKLRKFITHLSQKYSEKGYSWKVSPMLCAVIGGLAKVYIAELVEEAKLIQLEEIKLDQEYQVEDPSISSQNECPEDRPIEQKHINMAYERLQSRDQLFQRIKKISPFYSIKLLFKAPILKQFNLFNRKIWGYFQNKKNIGGNAFFSGASQFQSDIKWS